MKREIILSAFIIASNLFSVALVAQAPTFDWVKSSGGTLSDEYYSMAIDSSGNIYTTGYFMGTVDFDPGLGASNLTSAGDGDIFVQKLDSSGNLIWVKKMGGTLSDLGSHIALDAMGNVYVTGWFKGTADFDPGAATFNLNSAGNYDIFVLKLDSNGTFIWANSMGSTAIDHGLGISVDVSGNVLTTGVFQGAVDFNPGGSIFNLTSAGGRDIFIQKLNANGNFIWAKRMGGIYDDEGNSITTDTSGNIYTTGFFHATADFDPGAGTVNLVSAGYADIFIQKMDAGGNLIWAKRIGGIEIDAGLSIATDALGNIYTTGYFDETADFDPGLGNALLTAIDEGDIFIYKLDANGNYVWAKGMGGTGWDSGESIAVDNYGNVYTTGWFDSWVVDFDPGVATLNLTKSGNIDMFIHKLDVNGNLEWVQHIGAPLHENGMSIALDGIGNIYTGGIFLGTVDFDPGAGTANLTSAGGNDFFILKLNECVPSNGFDVITSCDSLTWINGVTYTTSNNTATFILSNASNCDSVVTLNLTINSVTDISTSLNGITISANNPNATYQWLDCNNNFAIIPNQTGQSFTPSANGNYAVQLSENGCVDTSNCISVSTIGQPEFGESVEFKVFPNPSTGSYTIEFQKSIHDIELHVHDLQGRLISVYRISNSSIATFELSAAPGVYLLTILTGETYENLFLLKE